ncbi:MAG: hypothetical protein JSU91_03425 [Thermoplasmatales archaeon]|nr:MAG: hypothetical protein JSU91_03425 [Thermoplasmatales archaeon]
MSIFPTHVSSTTQINHNEKPGEIFFGLKSHVDITWDENETYNQIMPLEEVRVLSFNISYWVTWGILGQLTNYYLKDRGVNINIEIINKPDFCNAYLDENEISIPFPKKQNIKELYNNFIRIFLKLDAPAFEAFNITLQATMESEIKGPLGFITFLSPANKIVNITLLPDYYGNVGYLLPEGNIIETPPLVEKQLPIKLYNFGNGKSLIESEIISAPSDFIVYLDPENLILDVLENKTIYLKVIAPSNFSGIETITSMFTPSFLGRPDLKGQPEIITFYCNYNPS